jgi:hypothetical protein
LQLFLSEIEACLPEIEDNLPKSVLLTRKFWVAFTLCVRRWSRFGCLSVEFYVLLHSNSGISNWIIRDCLKLCTLRIGLDFKSKSSPISFLSIILNRERKAEYIKPVA